MSYTLALAMQAPDSGPVIIAYDGSELAKAAVRSAAHLLKPVRALIVTVWEPGLALIANAGDAIPPGSELPGPDFETAVEVDRMMAEHASSVAEQGAALARSIGLDAEPVAVPDEANVPETIVRLAEEHKAQVVAVGSRGLSGLKATFLGSTSQGVVHRAHVPVLVVRDGTQSQKD
jgi:nucleotide-binding universal stress UspA family protein